MQHLTTTDGVRLYVETHGPDSAPAVVLVHGLAADTERSWHATGVVTRLVDAGLHVVAYDARGHGRSDGPHEVDRYGDARLAADLAEIAHAFAGAHAVVVGYSLGASTTLLALAAGLPAKAAVIGGAPTAVLRWSDNDETTRAIAVAALEGPEVDPSMQWWIDYLDATGADRRALAAFLRAHQPIVRDWDRIAVPVVVAAGTGDTTAAPLDELAERLSSAMTLRLPGDHITAVGSTAFTDAIITAATTP